jgi:hypothetical protein
MINGDAHCGSPSDAAARHELRPAAGLSPGGGTGGRACRFWAGAARLRSGLASAGGCSEARGGDGQREVACGERDVVEHASADVGREGSGEEQG